MKYNDNGLWKTLNVKVTDTLPVGTIIPYAGTTIPSNYMKCEGQELSRIEYDILFSAIGTTYGVGDGSTTFNLPNLKGRVITGIDSNDTDFDALGGTGGEKTHTLTIQEIPSHSHQFLFDHTAGSNIDAVKTGGSSAWQMNTTSRGEDQAHNNLQPYIALNYIIKVLDAPAIQAQVVNGYSTSSIDSYSCNYVNSINTCSTDEIRVGTWIDGKPIYRKVINFGTLPNINVKYVNHNIENMETVINLYGIFNDSTYQIKIPAGGEYNSNIQTTDTQIGIGTPQNLTSFSGYVIIEYTKTTD